MKVKKTITFGMALGGILLVLGMTLTVISQRTRLLPLIPKQHYSYYREQDGVGYKYVKDILYITFNANMSKRQIEEIFETHNIILISRRLDGSYEVKIPQTKDSHEMEKIIEVLRSLPEIAKVEKSYIIPY